MFSNLSDRLTESFKQLRGHGILSESDVDETVSQIRRALIDADVALPVVREFTAAVRERAYGATRSQGLNPSQQVVRIVRDQLVETLGGETRELHFADRGPTVFMLAGLQGAGKTTLLRLLAHLEEPDMGEVVDGHGLKLDCIGPSGPKCRPAAASSGRACRSQGVGTGAGERSR